MKKTELLCPAGNFEMLKRAINAGADAVYLSGVKFGARKYADNFNNNEIIDAINYAHLYGVKVYITINTLIKDDEIDEFLKFVEFIHKNKVDAVLMQDIGMINLVRSIFPNLVIHASTQFHNHNKYGLEYLKSIGVKRAVLAREMSLDEINKIDVDIEKEIFIHGALCISYSGQCLMSSMIMKRSGNRGECAGLCRLPYKLLKNDEYVNTNGNYLLSTKDLCSLNNITKILDSNITSIKIEGRMKSPEYVYYVTSLYRKIIDNYYLGKETIISEDEMNNLKVLFNRKFTTGYLFNDKDIMNQETPNHQGIEVGKIVDITPKKLKIKLTSELNQGDAIRFKDNNVGMYLNYIYDKKGNFINSSKDSEYIYIDNKFNLTSDDIILKTVDNKLLKSINTIKPKKIPINIEVNAKTNQKLEITFNDEKNTIVETGNIITESKNSPTTKNQIIEKLSKLNETPYSIKNIKINMDNNIFIPLKELNNIRRILVDKLNSSRININSDFVKKDFKKEVLNIELTNTINVLIDNENDYNQLKDLPKIKFYTSNIDLYSKYKNNMFLRLNRIQTKEVNYKNENLLITDIGSIYHYKNINYVNSDIYTNVTNIFTIHYLTKLGVKNIGISPELNFEETIKLYNDFVNYFNYKPNINIFVYGKIELMLMKHCIINYNLNHNVACNACKHVDKYKIEDRNGQKYTIEPNMCGNVILSNKIINNFDKIKMIGGLNYYISLIDINEKQKIIESIRKCVIC